MEVREQIFRLLHIALIEMRSEAYEKQNMKIFHIADIFHTVPLLLDRVQLGEITYDEVFSSIKTKASEKNCMKILENMLENASR